MFTGSGHEPHHFPELERVYGPSTPAKKRTVVLVMAVGSATSMLLWFIAQLAGVRFLGDQSPMTADEILWSNGFSWMAFVAFVLTIAATAWTARNAKVSWFHGFGLALFGIVVGLGMCLAALAGWFGLLG